MGGGRIKQSLTELELLYSEIKVIAVRKLILGGRDTGTLVDSVCVWEVWGCECVCGCLYMYVCACEWVGVGRGV